jgi:hypothetical protein
MSSPRDFLMQTSPATTFTGVIRAMATAGKATVGGISPHNNVNSFDATAQLLYSMTGTYQNDVIVANTLVFPLNQVIVSTSTFSRVAATRFI